MIITASLILNPDRTVNVIPHGALVIQDGHVLAVGQEDKIRKRFPTHRIMRLDGAVLHPGLVNAHAHLELPPLIDKVRAETFPDWVLNLIRRKRNLSQDVYRAAVHKNIESLIRTGTTCVGEISTHQVSPIALRASGLRAAIFHELITMSPGPITPFPLPRKTRGLIRQGISPHTPYTVSEAVLRQLVSIMRAKRLPVCMHVAESKDENRLLRREPSGIRRIYDLAGWDPAWAPAADSPFAYLDILGLLRSGFLAVHAVQADTRDIGIIKRSGAAIAHCPRSNHELGVGRMPLKKFLDANIPVALGTDSLASVPNLNMWDEMRYAYKIHRRDGITARDIIRLATTGGAKALGLGDEIGALAPGKRADIIAVPLPSRYTGDLYSDLLRETESCIMNMVNGKILIHRR